MNDKDIEDIWQSILDALPDATERERLIAFARAILSARVMTL